MLSSKEENTMESTKKLISIMLSLCLMVGLLPTRVFAEEDDGEDDPIEISTDTPLGDDNVTVEVEEVLDCPVKVEAEVEGSFSSSEKVTIYVAPEDGGSVSYNMDYDTMDLMLEATPDDGYRFLAWMDMDNEVILSTENQFTLHVEHSMKIYAIFYLAVSVYSGIEHGTLEIKDEKTLYFSGDTVTLVGHPDPGYVVDYYLAGEIHDGHANLTRLDGETFVMTSWNMAVAVAFVPGYTISANVSSEGSGTVSGSGSYLPGDRVILSAEAADGYTFLGWEENGTTVSTTPIYSFTANADRSLTAHFESYEGMTFTVDAVAFPEDSGSFKGTGTYSGGETVTLTALPNPGYSFSGWTEYGTTVSTEPVYSFTANANRTLTATFQNAGGVPYVDEAGNDLLCEEYTTLLSNTDSMPVLSSGWYVAAGDVSFQNRIEISGDVHLILCDGAVLSVPKGIHLTGSHKLTIFGQSQGSGELVIDNVSKSNASIGGNVDEPGGNLTINGGTIHATSSFGAAAIGGGGSTANTDTVFTEENCGMNTRGWAGTITINEGTVTAVGSEYGAGIGCGKIGHGGTITINGGTVTATGGHGATGIGGADGSTGYHQGIGSILVTGGTVTAYGGKYAAGIGGGLWGKIGNITITGGTIYAYGGHGGAGIGCGDSGSEDGFINISDGQVNATGGDNGAGIGGGRSVYGTIQISGGKVNAIGGSTGAGIGGGRNSGEQKYAGGVVTITGGDITAKAGTAPGGGAGIGGGAYGPGGDVTISGGTVQASGEYLGAGIGNGNEAEGGTVTITDGIVTATGGAKGAGIGGGYKGNGGTVTLSGGNVTVNGGRNAAGIGGGESGAGGTVKIIGGTAWIRSGYGDNFDLPAQAVGHGDGSSDPGTLSFDDISNDVHVRVGYIDRVPQWASLSSREAYARRTDITIIIQSCGAHNYDAYGNCSWCGAGGGPLLQNISFVDEEGQSQGSPYCKVLTSSDTTWHTVGAHGGRYAVTGDLTISERITINGNVNLILCDGATLTAPKGIEVAEGNSLTIWRQEGATGVLIAGASCNAGDAAIGGGNGKNAGNITVRNGNVISIAGTGAQAIGHGAGATGSGSLTLLNTQIFDSDGSTQPVGAEMRDSVCRSGWVRLVPCLSHEFENRICRLCDRHIDIDYLDPADGNLHICSSFRAYNGQLTISEGWYVLATDVETIDRISISGNVNMILCDGCTWKAEAGITLEEGASLTLWAQSNDDGMGALISTGTSGQAGIETTGGELAICGGAITASGGENGAGIGGNADAAGGSMTIRGGIVSATGGANAQAIGRGSGSADSGTLDITKYKVGYLDNDSQTVDWASQEEKIEACRNTECATVHLENCDSHTDNDCDGLCDECGYRIGYYYLDPETGENLLCSSFSIYNGGNVLNGGWYVVDTSREISSRIKVQGDVHLILCDGVELTAVKGIRVTAGKSLTIWAQSTASETVGKLTITKPSMDEAAIGGNETMSRSSTDQNCGNVTINGGHIIISCSSHGAGIGGGGNYEDKYNGGNGGTVVIRAGTVDITSQHGAAIGGGTGRNGGNGGTVTISGGTVNLTSASSYGSGIGGGRGSRIGGDGGTITVSGGRLNIVKTSYGVGIGGGYGSSRGGAAGTITVSGGTIMLTGSSNNGKSIGGGDSSGKDGTLNINGVRVGIIGGDNYVNWVQAADRDSTCRSKKKMIRLEICGHSEAVFTNSGDGSYTVTCPHCGFSYEGELCTVSFDRNGGTGIMYPVQVVPNQPYRLPESGFTGPTGTTLGCWIVDGEAKLPGDTIVVTDDVTITAEWRMYSDGIGERLAGYSLSLDGDIAVKFYMELADEVAESDDAYMQFIIPNGTKTITEKIPVGNAEKKKIDDKTYYVFKCKVSAKDMGSEIKAQVFNGEVSGNEYTYSVKEYADYILAHGTESQYTNAVAFVQAMLNYGTAAQTYFGVTGEVPNSNMSEKEKRVSSISASTLQSYAYDPSTTSLPEGVEFVGATLSLKSETTLSLYFTSDIPLEQLEFSCGDLTVEKAQVGEYVVARIRNISFKELNVKRTLTVTVGETSGKIKYSPLTYCYNILNGGSDDENLIAVCRALYDFYGAAKKYARNT